MGTLYENIVSLCENKGIKPSKMCVELELSKSLVTKLKSNPEKTITAETAQKIADYFGVSVDRVLGTEQKEKPTISEEDDELNEILEACRDRSDLRMLFKLANGATADDVKQAIKIIEALRNND